MAYRGCDGKGAVYHQPSMDGVHPEPDILKDNGMGMGPNYLSGVHRLCLGINLRTKQNHSNIIALKGQARKK